jgi:hypothetical protein
MSSQVLALLAEMSIRGENIDQFPLFKTERGATQRFRNIAALLGDMGPFTNTGSVPFATLVA